MPRGPVALLAAVMLLGTVLALPATAATQPYTITAQRILVVDGPGNDEQVIIDADLYVPNGVTASRRAPVVLAAHGFGGSKTDFAGKEADFLARHGYIVLAYSARGFGATTGEIGLDSPDYDVKDVRQLLDWLAKRPEVLLDQPGDPRVGMIGPSYGGGIQLMTAEFDTRIDAIVPFIAWNSLVYALSPNNIAPDLRHRPEDGGVFKWQWTTLLFTLGAAQPVLSPDGATVPPRTCLGFVDGLCEAYARTTATGNADADALALLARSSPETLRSRLRVPTLLFQGESDTLFNLNDAVANYTALQANRTPVKMVWINGGHGYPDAPGERSWTDPTKDVIAGRVLAWFERYLRRDVRVSTGPGFEYFRDWIPYDTTRSAAPAYGAASAYPVGRPTTLFLSSDGTLGPAEDARPGSVSFVNPPAGAPLSYSETSNFQSSQFQDVPATDPPGASSHFTTRPLPRAQEVVGIPTVTFDLAAATEATVFAKLYDVAPDGTKTLVRRLVAPVRAAGLPKRLTITLAGIVHRFSAGHRIQLVVAATDAAYRAQPVPTTYTITIAKEHPAMLSLPLTDQTDA